MFKTEIVDSFDYNRLYGREKYSLQKMEMKAVNFPIEVEPNLITAVWSDRINNEWIAALKLIETQYTGDAFFAGATNESFMVFAKAIAKVIGFKHKVTGARITRYTNAASGYPCFVLEVTSGGKGIQQTHLKTDYNDVTEYRMHPKGYFIARGDCDETDGTMDYD